MLGDLRLGESLKIGQADHVALFIRQRPEGAMHRFMNVPAGYRGLVGFPGRNDRGRFRGMALEPGGPGLAPAPGSQPVDGPVSGDTDEPGDQPVILVHQVHPVPHDGEGFLDDIFRFVPVAQHSLGDSEQPGSRHIDQFDQRPFVPGRQPVPEGPLAAVGKQSSRRPRRFGRQHLEQIATPPLHHHPRQALMISPDSDIARTG
jgi:hypothetical protein